MIDIRYSQKGTPYVWASEIHRELGCRGPVDVWFIPLIRKGDFTPNHHYWEFERIDEETALLVKDWSVKLDMAKYILASLETERSHSLIKYLLYLEERRNDGGYLTHQQNEALMDIAEILGLFSMQKFLQREHYEQFLVDYKPNQWWEYRANLFNITVADMRAIIAARGIEYKSMRQAIFQIDRYELIKHATVDLFKAMGKSHQYAINMGNMTKSFAKRMNVYVYNDLGFTIDFNTEVQRNTIAQVRTYRQKSTLLGPFQNTPL